MPASRQDRPATRQRVLISQTLVDDKAGDATSADKNAPIVQRQLADATQRAASQLRDRSGIAVDLIVGANTITHLLGRVPRAVTITPTVASATWAWALTSADDKQAVITCVGVAQPGAWMEFA